MSTAEDRINALNTRAAEIFPANPTALDIQALSAVWLMLMYQMPDDTFIAYMNSLTQLIGEIDFPDGREAFIRFKGRLQCVGLIGAEFPAPRR